MVDEYIMTLESVKVTKIAIINEDINALISHDSQRAKGRTPRINKVSYSKNAKIRRPQVPY